MLILPEYALSLISATTTTIPHCGAEGKIIVSPLFAPIKKSFCVIKYVEDDGKQTLFINVPQEEPEFITYPAYGNTQPLVVELAIITDLAICSSVVGSTDVIKPAVASLKKYVVLILRLDPPVKPVTYPA